MSELTCRERFRRVLNFQPVDRMPVVEWAPWWDMTLGRWRSEGLPAGLDDHAAVQRHFGLDVIRQVWIKHLAADAPQPAHHGVGLIADAAGYDALAPHLYGAGYDPGLLRRYAEEQAAGKSILWLTLEGFFWFPRRLLGIEPHLYTFYDDPDLMDRINTDLLDHQLRMLDEILAVCTPDFMTFAEDMSYNHGPMLSREMFERFEAPFYRQVIPRLREAGVRVFIDSDGDVSDLIEWFRDLGAEGFVPLERMAGVDVVEFRSRWSDLLMLGAFDKTVMHRGEPAVRAEFERLLPVMRSGGFVASVDHQTPPGVSLQDYHGFLELFRQYAALAAQ